MFNDLSFLVIAKSGKIYGVRNRAISPADPGNSKEECSIEYAYFKNIILHPGWQLNFDVVADFEAVLDLRLLSSSEAVNLKKSNFETWLVKYESNIFLTLIIIGGIGVFILLVVGAIRKVKVQCVKRKNE